MPQLDTAMYYATNENLYSIVKGMNITEKDRILAICGSGDQIFAMLEKNPKKIIAVDISESQMNFAENRLNSLKNGDYEGFLRTDLIKYKNAEFINSDHEEIVERNKYFNKKRLERIRANLCALEFKLENIFNTDLYKNISKVYLSNCKLNEEFECLEYINKIPKGIEIYLTDSDNMLSICLSERAKFCKKQSKKARKYYENLKGNKHEWWPAIFKL